jgi:hypothetical protein
MPGVLAIEPGLSGPPSLMSVAFDLHDVGYGVSEHIVAGTARAYTEPAPRTDDGRWTTVPGDEAPFTTRCVIHRPLDAADANGTVVVEWLNVTGGLDVPAVWMATHRHLLRARFTWVGVTAQHVGVHGGGIMPGLGLRDLDPERYERLDHPGDAHAFDVFARIARALRTFLPETFGLPVDRLVATGASQSAVYLTTYVNAVDPGDAVFDGFLLQGRAGRGAPIAGWDPSAINPTNTDAGSRWERLVGRDRIRDDVRVPVIVVQSETDVFGALGFLPARQPDGERFRLWEVAGASHCDTYFLSASPLDAGTLPVAELAALIANAEPEGFPIEAPINSGPQMHYVLERAFDALERWLRDGEEPARAARLEVDGEGPAVDELGIARGGIRTPFVDTPVAVLSGLGQTAALADLFGTTRALSAEQLRARYPGGRDAFVAEFADATRAAVDSGFVLATDAAEIEALGACSWCEG